jgi:abortive infection bacteriophage resistance protein
MQAVKVNHVFKPNSRFEDVVAQYNFDSELRLLVFNAIERIEITLRSCMINHRSHEVDGTSCGMNKTKYSYELDKNSRKGNCGLWWA